MARVTVYATPALAYAHLSPSPASPLRLSIPHNEHTAESIRHKEKDRPALVTCTQREPTYDRRHRSKTPNSPHEHDAHEAIETAPLPCPHASTSSLLRQHNAARHLLIGRRGRVLRVPRRRIVARLLPARPRPLALPRRAVDVQRRPDLQRPVVEQVVPSPAVDGPAPAPRLAVAHQPHAERAQVHLQHARRRPVVALSRPAAAGDDALEEAALLTRVRHHPERRARSPVVAAEDGRFVGVVGHLVDALSRTLTHFVDPLLFRR